MEPTGRCVCSAAARRGKSLFIVDVNEEYGESGASLGWREFHAWGQKHASALADTTIAHPNAASGPSEDLPPSVSAVPVRQAPSGIKALQFEVHDEARDVAPRGFCIDLTHQACPNQHLQMLMPSKPLCPSSAAHE